MVSDSKDITPRTIRAHNLGAGSVTTAKVGKKIIHTAAADPTAASDAGTGYEVGSLWNNTSSGEIFICKDSSEENSVWIGQEGENINLVQHAQGSSDGYVWGGDAGPGQSPRYQDDIEKYSFSSDANASDSGEYNKAATFALGAKYSSTLFAIGGRQADNPASTPLALVETISSFPTTAPHPVTDHGELTGGTWRDGGLNDSGTHTYMHGGSWDESVADTIEKFAKASASSSTDVGETASVEDRAVGCPDSIGSQGFQTAGRNQPGSTYRTDVQKYSMASDGAGSDTGNELSQAYTGHVTATDESYGFAYTGYIGPPGGIHGQDDIDRFAFSSPYAGTDVGEMSDGPYQDSGQNQMSATHGYKTGGMNPSGESYIDVIDKFAYASPYSSEDVGNLTVAKTATSGASV
tara:strand:+ start:788 stop:2008 length:1221 start_codon:yes stop_codon:yes gene_type:complete